MDFLNHLESLNMTQDSRLSMKSFGFSLPKNIKKLTLSNFSLPWREMARIAELQNLGILKLLADAFQGKCWIIADGKKFRSLKFLKLRSLNVQQWIAASHENFPSLEQIVVEQCHSLQEIPKTFVDIQSLKMIQIRQCQSSVVISAREIEEEQLEIGNVNFKVQAMEILAVKFFR